MDATLYCLLGPNGDLHVTGNTTSFADFAATCHLSEPDCEEAHFDLAARTLGLDRVTPAGAERLQAFVDAHVGTPERLMDFALEGEMPKADLAGLLSLEDRPSYLEACARIERAYTEACAATHDACLASGCPVVDVPGEVCLQPLLRAGGAYRAACAEAWTRLFRSPAHRIGSWQD
jgi:hypothetical protein